MLYDQLQPTQIHCNLSFHHRLYRITLLSCLFDPLGIHRIHLIIIFQAGKYFRDHFVTPNDSVFRHCQCQFF